MNFGNASIGANGTISGAVVSGGSIVGGTINIGNGAFYINSSGSIGAVGTVGGNTGLYKGASGSFDFVYKVSLVLGVLSYDLHRAWFCKGLFIGITDP